ncbi:YmdB family metallophosphoesterase [Candidatus Bealeia paramacronuclearis]|uniref:YmdB family metallophosphoesterase n=1 Tax=Candidatus Bealeia paramacronuclearis TaxID=1921001 RepID=A0ABZ2C210_9PROT|nr:YmdB family metallophosphoesterase [Candidatus Bealeia paramacronuclearis]
MKILFIGDLVGLSGRKVVVENLPGLRRQLNLDFVIANAENAAHGFGITGRICEELYEVGVDVITSGNHMWDNKDILPRMKDLPRLLRPLNYPPGTPGQGSGIYTTKNGKRVGVMNVMCRLFMDTLDDPFRAIQKELETMKLGHDVDALVIDVHGEASSEKAAMGYFVDGRASLIVGTHTHVPTADERIQPKGTAFMTDAGMTGDYDSVIGMKKDVPFKNF